MKKLTVDREFVGVYCVQPDGEVNDATVYHWCQYACRQFRDDFSEEVCADWVHVIVDFSQEHGPFIWEDQNNVLDRVEGDGHGHEEEGSITVLNTLDCAITVLEKDNCENGSDYSNDELDVWGLGKTNSVEEVSAQKKSKLVEPRDVVLLNILICDRFYLGMYSFVIIL